MNKEDIIRMAREAQLPYYFRTGEILNVAQLEHFVALVAAAEREKVAQWMIKRSYTTGHGDTTEDLLAELDWQITERIAKYVDDEREECAKVADTYDVAEDVCSSDTAEGISIAIRARGEQ